MVAGALKRMSLVPKAYRHFIRRRSMKHSSIWFALILIVSALLLSAAKPSPKPTRESRNPYSAQNPPTTYAATISPQADVTALPTPAGVDHANAKYETAQYQLNRIQTWFNGCLALFTLALVAVGAWQGYHLRQTMKATKEAADAAVLSAKTIRETQRGHIFGIPMAPIQDFAVGREPRISFGLKNVGSTRIYDCVAETWVEVLKKPFVDFSNNAHHQRKEDRFALYPNAPGPPCLILMRWNEPLTEQQFRDIQADKWALCIRVSLQYRDAFGVAVTQNFAFSSNSVIWETLPKYND